MSDRREAELTELEALMAIAREHDFDAMLVEEGSWRLELVRREATSTAAPVYAAPVPAVLAEALVVQAAPAVAAVEPGEVIAAPIVGVFYRSPAPTALPFVEVGDRVSLGQTLCILEAMKLMNEITADVAGTVAAILSENGQLVTIGQPLIRIVP